MIKHAKEIVEVYRNWTDDSKIHAMSEFNKYFESSSHLEVMSHLDKHFSTNDIAFKVVLDCFIVSIPMSTIIKDMKGFAILDKKEWETMKSIYRNVSKASDFDDNKDNYFLIDEKNLMIYSFTY